jgi:hypothetical protein
MEKTNRENIIDTRKIHEEKRRMMVSPSLKTENNRLLKTEEPRLLEDHEDFLIEEHSKDVLLHWSAPEFELSERDKKWYLWITGFLFAMIFWAIWSNSPIMAITFILIGVVGYIYLNKEPKIVSFFITRDGVVADKEIFDYESINSFWIFYEPDGLQSLSLHTKGLIIPQIHIPLGNEDPLKIREILVKHIPEEKHDPGPLETLERILKI